MLTKLIEEIRADRSCSVSPPTRLPSVPEGLELPADLAEFYRLCGGMEIYCQSSLGFRILPAEEVVPVNSLIIGELYEEDGSSRWFAVAEDGNGNDISIDFSKGKKNGFCYDSSVERHGLVGECAVVARCFTNLLKHLYEAKGASIFWTEPDFPSLGDAYDD